MAALRAAERLRENVTKDGDCSIWQGNISVHGYGRIVVNSKLYYAHRLAKALALGVGYDKTLQAHHVCRKRLCVNPDHLELLSPEAHTREHHPLRQFCKRGHDMSITRVSRYAVGGGYCGECARDRARVGYWEWKKTSWRPPAPRECEVCRSVFTPQVMNGARFCSPRCRIKSWKERQ